MVRRGGRTRAALAVVREGDRVVRVPAAAWREGSARFPDLRVPSLRGLLVLQAEALIGALGCAVAAARSRAGLVAAGLLLAHAAFGAARRLALARDNTRARDAWARGFPARVGEREVAAFVAGRGARFTLHLRRYEGRSGEALEPAAFLEDVKTGEACAVEPASFAVEHVCRAAGVAVAEGAAARIQRRAAVRLDPGARSVGG